MDAKNLVIDNCSNWKAIKALNELLPEFKGVSSFAFVVKSIDSVDGAALVVTSQKKKVFWIFDFVREHKANNLKILLSSVDVVTQKQVV